MVGPPSSAYSARYSGESRYSASWESPPSRMGKSKGVKLWLEVVIDVGC